MIKAVIFDEGGVLSLKSDLREFANFCAMKYGKDPAAFSELVVKSWKLARVSAIDSIEFWKRLGKFMDIGAVNIRRDFVASSSPREDALKLAKKLKGRYKLGILSNNIRDWFEEMVEMWEFGSTFDVILSSHMTKKAKPDREFYEEMVVRLGVKPDECVFIDDTEANIPPAKALGMKAIHFRDMKHLEKELKKLGVKW